MSRTGISGTGRRLEGVSACDDCAEEVALSFSFPLYQASGFAIAFVNSNGYVTFGIPSGAFSNHPLPSGQMPGNLVAALFTDLYPRGGGSIYFQDYGDGAVDFLYLRLGGVKNTATVGIQNGNTDDGLGVARAGKRKMEKPGFAPGLCVWFVRSLLAPAAGLTSCSGCGGP